MSSIDTQLKLVDRFSKPLKSMANQTEVLINRVERLQRLTKNGVGFDKIPPEQKRVKANQDEITESVERTERATNRTNNRFKQMAITVLSVGTALAGIRIADTFTLTSSRLDLVNDGLRTSKELQDLIFQSAERSRGSYESIASTVSRIGILAKDAFGSTEEIVAFTELVQKSFKIAGTDTAGQQAGLLQLSQALASGRLQGDEFVSISENAPLLAQAIADFVGVSKGELKELSSEGVITSDIIKGAVFNASQEIESNFRALPRTFADIGTQIKNNLLQQVVPVIDQISQLLNSPAGAQAVDFITQALVGAVQVIAFLIENIIYVGTVIRENWSFIAPLVYGIVTALILWNTYNALVTTGTFLNAVSQGVLTTAVFIQQVAVLGLRTAWLGLNAVMRANVIILVISALVALVTWLVNAFKTNDKFAEGLLRTWNHILNFFDKLPAYFFELASILIKPFQLWANTIGTIYDKVINTIISGINTVLSLVNKITGSSYEIAGEFSFAKLTDQIATTVDIKKDQAYANAARKATQRESELQAYIQRRQSERGDIAPQQGFNPDELSNGGFDYSKYGDVSGTFGAGAGNLKLDEIGKVKEVGKIRDEVDIASEDLKLLRELAEINNIQNFVTLQPQLTFGDTNIRQDGRSVDEIISNIAEYLNDQMASSARGLYNVG